MEKKFETNSTEDGEENIILGSIEDDYRFKDNRGAEEGDQSEEHILEELDNLLSSINNEEGGGDNLLTADKDNVDDHGLEDNSEVFALEETELIENEVAEAKENNTSQEDGEHLLQVDDNMMPNVILEFSEENCAIDETDETEANNAFEVNMNAGENDEINRDENDENDEVNRDENDENDEVNRDENDENDEVNRDENDEVNRDENDENDEVNMDENDEVNRDENDENDENDEVNRDENDENDEVNRDENVEKETNNPDKINANEDAENETDTFESIVNKCELDMDDFDEISSEDENEMALEDSPVKDENTVPVCVIVKNAPKATSVETLKAFFPTASKIQIPRAIQPSYGHVVLEFPSIKEATNVYLKNCTSPVRIGGKTLQLLLLGWQINPGCHNSYSEPDKGNGGHGEDTSTRHSVATDELENTQSKNFCIEHESARISGLKHEPEDTLNIIHTIQSGNSRSPFTEAKSDKIESLSQDDHQKTLNINFQKSCVSEKSSAGASDEPVKEAADAEQEEQRENQMSDISATSDTGHIDQDSKKISDQEEQRQTCMSDISATSDTGHIDQDCKKISGQEVERKTCMSDISATSDTGHFDQDSKKISELEEHRKTCMNDISATSDTGHIDQDSKKISEQEEHSKTCMSDISATSDTGHIDQDSKKISKQEVERKTCMSDISATSDTGHLDQDSKKISEQEEHSKTCMSDISATSDTEHLDQDSKKISKQEEQRKTCMSDISATSDTGHIDQDSKKISEQEEQRQTCMSDISATSDTGHIDQDSKKMSEQEELSKELSRTEQISEDERHSQMSDITAESETGQLDDNNRDISLADPGREQRSQMSDISASSDMITVDYTKNSENKDHETKTEPEDNTQGYMSEVSAGSDFGEFDEGGKDASDREKYEVTQSQVSGKKRSRSILDRDKTSSCQTQTHRFDRSRPSVYRKRANRSNSSTRSRSPDRKRYFRSRKYLRSPDQESYQQSPQDNNGSFYAGREGSCHRRSFHYERESRSKSQSSRYRYFENDNRKRSRSRTGRSRYSYKSSRSTSTSPSGRNRYFGEDSRSLSRSPKYRKRPLRSYSGSGSRSDSISRSFKGHSSSRTRSPADSHRSQSPERKRFFSYHSRSRERLYRSNSNEFRSPKDRFKKDVVEYRPASSSYMPFSKSADETSSCFAGQTDTMKSAGNWPMVNTFPPPNMNPIHLTNVPYIHHPQMNIQPVVNFQNPPPINFQIPPPPLVYQNVPQMMNFQNPQPMSFHCQSTPGSAGLPLNQTSTTEQTPSRVTSVENLGHTGHRGAVVFNYAREDNLKKGNSADQNFAEKSNQRQQKSEPPGRAYFRNLPSGSSSYNQPEEGVTVYFGNTSRTDEANFKSTFRGKLMKMRVLSSLIEIQFEKNRGYQLMKFSNRKTAKCVIEKFNLTVFKSRVLHVCIYKPGITEQYDEDILVRFENTGFVTQEDFFETLRSKLKRIGLVTSLRKILFNYSRNYQLVSFCSLSKARSVVRLLDQSRVGTMRWRLKIVDDIETGNMPTGNRTGEKQPSVVEGGKQNQYVPGYEVFLGHMPPCSCADIFNFFNRLFVTHGLCKPGRKPIRTVHFILNRTYQFLVFYEKKDALACVKEFQYIKFNGTRLTLKYGKNLEADEMKGTNRGLKHSKEETRPVSHKGHSSHTIDTGVNDTDGDLYSVYLYQLPIATYGEIKSFVEKELVSRGSCAANETIIQRIDFKDYRKYQFVWFNRLSDAVDCVRYLHHADFKGSQIKAQMGKSQQNKNEKQISPGKTYVFVGLTPMDTSADEIEDFFTDQLVLHRVSAKSEKIIKKVHYLQGRKHQYLQFYKICDALACAKELDGIEFKGHRIQVKYCRYHKEKQKEEKKEQCSKQEFNLPKGRKGIFQVCLGEMPPTSPEEIKAFFLGQFVLRGLCSNPDIIRNVLFQKERSYQFIEFYKMRDALLCIKEFDGVVFKGTKITVTAGKNAEEASSLVHTELQSGKEDVADVMGEYEVLFRNVPNCKRKDLFGFIKAGIIRHGVQKPKLIKKIKFCANRSFQIVVFYYQEAAKVAVEQMNGIYFKGNRLAAMTCTASKDKEQDDKSSTGVKDTDSIQNMPDEGFSVQINNVTVDATFEDFQIIFENALVRHRVCKPEDKNRIVKEYKFKQGETSHRVVFNNQEQGMAAIQSLNNTSLMGSYVTLEKSQ